MTTLYYQVLSQVKGSQYRTSTIRFRSHDRAMREARRSKLLLGNCTVLIQKRNEYGYELVETIEI